MIESRLTIEFTYPDDIDPDENSIDRRQRIIENYFGQVKLSFADPFN